MSDRKWYEINLTEKEIKEGDDITMYYCCDNYCYYVTKVINQKHIFVKPYEVSADHSLPLDVGHQNWLYFKTVKEKNQYLNSVIKTHYNEDDPVENKEEEWSYRYGAWYLVKRYDINTWNKCLELARKECKDEAAEDKVVYLARLFETLSDEEHDKVLSGETVTKYTKLKPVSFGIRDYYHEWSF